jgi:predicted PurR-regulated permease PerM
MTCNIGKTERALRVTLGIVLVIIGIVTSGTQGVIVGVVGFIPLGTGLVGNCPAYTLFGINTCKPHEM